MRELQLSMLMADPGSSTATISDDSLYRYDLTRTWGDDPSRRVLFIMLNPSKADASVPDPTMTRCRNYAESWGYHGLAIVNLFALRSTDPDALLSARDPIGPENDRFVADWASRASLVVLGWGAHKFIGDRAKAVTEIVRKAGVTPHYLKLTKEGHPGHPLFLRADLKPIPMEAKP